MVTTLNSLKIPINIYFGANDWMALRTRSGTQLTNPKIKERMIKDASHLIQMDNPGGLIDGMLNDANDNKMHYFVSILRNTLNDLTTVLRFNSLLLP